MKLIKGLTFAAVIGGAFCATPASADVTFLYGFQDASMTLNFDGVPAKISFTGTFEYDVTTTEVSDVNFTIMGPGISVSPDDFYQSGGATILQVNSPYNLAATDNTGNISVNLDFANSLGNGAPDLLALNNDDSQLPNIDGRYAASVSGEVVPVSAVPESATWAMFLLGFGGIGVMLRNSRRKPTVAAA